jgi:threonine/homoserine/homoserine lactone efflux protein
VSASDITLVVVSNVFTVLFSSLLDYKTPIGLVGSALLIVLGIYVLFFKKIKVNEEGVQVIKMRKRDYIKIFLSGFFMNTLNPSVIGFWLLTSTSLLVETLNYRLVVFVTCLIVVAIFDIAKVMLAGRIRQKLTPHNIHIVNRVSGLILIGFGVALMWGVLSFGDRLREI